MYLLPMLWVYLATLLQIIGIRLRAGLDNTGEAKVSSPLSFCIQNCNSLNLTGLSSNFDLKMLAIVESKADIIFLSDTRVISSQGISSEQRIKDYLRDCSGANTKLTSTAPTTVGAQ